MQLGLWQQYGTAKKIVNHKIIAIFLIFPGIFLYFSGIMCYYSPML